MSDLIPILKDRYNNTVSKIDRQFLIGICNYLDIFERPEIQVILEKQKQLPDGHYQKFLRSYNTLYRKIYTPMKNQPDLLWWKFMGFYDMPDSKKGFLFFVIPPLFSFKAYFFDLSRYTMHLTNIHNKLIVLLENDLAFEQPKPVQPVATPASQPVNPKFLQLRQKLGITQDTKWQDIKIRFINDEDVQISYKDRTFEATPADLDFINLHTGKPIVSWELLSMMSANKENPGTFPMGKVSEHEHQRWATAKQQLNLKLQTAFGILTEPFNPYNKASESYSVKFKLIPDDDEIRFGMHPQLPEEMRKEQY